MTAPRFQDVRVGDILPSLATPPLDRITLALFAGASGDHMPLHIDIDAARRAGMPDVFGHGMLSMAYIGRLITRWSPQSALRAFNVRFEGITHLGNALTCTGRVVETFESNGEKLVRIEIRASNQYGESKAAGDVLVALA
jgi:acyl dehydratase